MAREAADGDSPDLPVGGFCCRPYKCPFFDQCWPSEAEYPTYGLGGSWSQRAELAASGYRDIRDVPAGKLSNALHLRIHRISKAG